MKKAGVLGILSGVTLASSISLISAFSITEILNNWYAYGVFDYALPFLLVFALIYGILTKTSLLGDNLAVNAILAAALGLMSLFTPFPEFLRTFAPSLSIALSFMLGAILLLGLFWDKGDKSKTYWLIYLMIAVGIIGFISVFIYTMGSGLGSTQNHWDQYGPAIITLVILGGILWAIIAGSKK